MADFMADLGSEILFNCGEMVIGGYVDEVLDDGYVLVSYTDPVMGPALTEVRDEDIVLVLSDLV